MRSRMLVVAAGLGLCHSRACRLLHRARQRNETLLHRRAAADHSDERHRRGRQGLHVADGSGGCLEDRQGLRERRNGWRTRGRARRACTTIKRASLFPEGVRLTRLTSTSAHATQPRPRRGFFLQGTLPCPTEGCSFLRFFRGKLVRKHGPFAFHQVSQLIGDA